MTSNKLETKLYARHSGYPGGFKQETLGHLLERRPEEVIRRAVKGMLPHNRLGAQQLRKLKIYAGPDHPHEAQRPEPLPEEQSTMATPAFYSGTGRRKTAIARVRLLPGEGEVVVNGRSLEEHFGNADQRGRHHDAVPGDRHRGPLQRDDQGRGRRRHRPGRRHPPRHRAGPARARPESNRLPLRQAGLLTRDPRMKERKKYGLKRARKAPQYTKR